MSQRNLEGLRASAGSGKTYSLTTRYLEALRAGAAPQRILATTFTRKAAGEILGRVLQRLAREAESDAEARTRLARLCRSLHQVSVCTLDSFFSRLAQCFRPELALPPDARLVDERSAEAAAVRVEAVRAALDEARASGEEEALLRLLEQLQGGAAQRSVAGPLDTLLNELSGIYHEADEGAWERLEVPAPLEPAALTAAVAALRAEAEAVQNGHWRNALKGDAAKAEATAWEKLVSGGLAAAVLQEKEHYSRLPLTEETHALYQPLLQHARAMLLGPVREQALATRDLLRRFERHYAAARRRRRILLFSDLPDALRRALPKRSAAEIAYRLDTCVDHLLLDEFQDTSTAQWEVLRPFAQRIAEGQGPEARSLFCVGDAKQSIYGWRGACPELFDRIVDTVTGLKWSSTARSYRSSQVVLDAVNRVFSTLAANGSLAKYSDLARRWQDGFEEHHAEKDLPGYVELVTSPRPPQPDDTDAGDEEQEGSTHLQYAAEVVRRLTEQAPGRSVGVLFRTNAGIAEFLYLLQHCGVNASGEGGGTLDDDPAVETVLAALMLADYPGHSAAAFQVARSPLGPLVGFEAGPEVPALVTALEVARQIRRRLLEEGLSEVLTSWSRGLAASCNLRSVQRLTQLMTLADGFPSGPTLRPATFVDYVRTTRVEEPAPAPVRVMTIHGAKGLEFDIVVLPELSKRIDPAYSRPPVLVERETPDAPVRAVHPFVRREIRELSPALQQAFGRHAEQELREQLCLLYVAMTRAVHALHMIVPPPGTRSNMSHAGVLRGALCASDQQELPEGGETLYSRGNSEWWKRLSPPVVATPCAPLPLSIHLAPEGNHPRNLPEVRPSELSHGGVVSAARLLALEDPVGVTFGTVIHALFAELCWVNEPLPAPELLLKAARRAAPGQPSPWHKETLARWYAILERPEVRAVLSRPDTPSGVELELWRERRFAVRVDDHLVNGTFDRVVITREAGKVLRVELIDYKTDEVGDRTPSLLADGYRPQLDEYGKALAVLLRIAPEAIHKRLLFVTSGRQWPLT